MIKQNIAVVLGSGGHTRQMLQLVSKLGNKYKYTYLIANTDKTSEKHIKIQGKVYKIKDTRLKTDKSILKIILKYIPSTIQAIFVLNKIKPKVIIACGPAMCLHTLVLAKYLFGTKLIFFESWVRVHNKSISGRQIAPFFTKDDLFMVQWESLLKKHPYAKFVGRLG
jgi:UDP-N-acetylglucosamine:LPS N-acetylglucosamine transferase